MSSLHIVLRQKGLSSKSKSTRKRQKLDCNCSTCSENDDHPEFTENRETCTIVVCGLSNLRVIKVGARGQNEHFVVMHSWMSWRMSLRTKSLSFSAVQEFYKCDLWRLNYKNQISDGSNVWSDAWSILNQITYIFEMFITSIRITHTKRKEITFAWAFSTPVLSFFFWIFLREPV